MTLTERIDRIETELRARIERAEKATPGPWEIWEGPGYVGGGEDLCIGSGPTWLYNMDNRSCKRIPCHWGCCELPADIPIASTGGKLTCECPEECDHQEQITQEQRANAELICSARTEHPQAHQALLAVLALARHSAEIAVVVGHKWAEDSQRLENEAGIIVQAIERELGLE